MTIRLKVLITILASLIVLNGTWIVYDIRKDIQSNKAYSDKENNRKDQIILDLYKKVNTLTKKVDTQYADLQININNESASRVVSDTTLNKSLKEFPKQQREEKIKIEQKLRQVNVVIKNKTLEAIGSGVSIKYKDKFYILTAGHMVDQATDELELWENNVKIDDLEIIKQAFTMSTTEEQEGQGEDLCLLKPKNQDIQPKFYTELADNEPIVGTQIYVVGNPLGIEDVISDGRVVVYQNDFVYYIDHSYFGNSGGGIYNLDGKLIGIVSHMVPLQPVQSIPPYILNGAVRLSNIVTFLENMNNER